MKSSSTKIAYALGAIIAAIVIAFGVSVLFAFPIKWLWNWLVPTVFGLKPISVMEAWGLSLLVKLIAPGKINLGDDKAK